MGAEKDMQAEAIAQLQARIARQKDIMKATHKSEAEEMEEMWKWVKISIFIAIPLVVAASAKDILFEEHAHRKVGPEPDYMAIRKKEFPWECENCALFDGHCWDACRAEKAAEGK
jgi:cytochrome c oxidase subunit 6a|eukprot:CAMPEP_0198288240 /NCGR_PEP_ID=MMETSP1449-20131203/6815_1 /TAXON_ID=420275 /ORGANISM="Attheya septentrionalis, Strain CCMP2084" /LENGTH=114 /DNA_ID=CAMNT_0043986353 /DNA_START=384 /DNA_END=728 /DNA_ORIENTATION=+